MAEHGSYRTIASPVQTELEIKRSRFLTFLEPSPDEAAARDRIAAIRRLHPKARHHCTAMVFGPGQELRRTNDDGEPSGTAGAPMLEALVAAEVSDVVAVVVRYFGGILLGAGGLTRAYRAGVAQALVEATTVRRELRNSYGVVVDYATAAAIEQEAARRGWAYTADYAAEVETRLAIPPAEEHTLIARLAEITAGATPPTFLGQSWVSLDL